MSRENVEVVRSMMEAWAGNAPETALRYLDADVEYDVRLRADGRLWNGHQGVRRALEEWTATWSDWSIEVESYLDLGDDRVAFLWRERGTARGSGIAMSQRGITVVTLRGGMVVSMVVQLDRERALAGVGPEGQVVSQENVELIGRVIGAMNARELDRYLSCCTEDVELRTPAIAGIYEGREGISRWFADLEDVGPDFHLEIDALEAVGADRVLAFLCARSTGRASGIPFATEVTNVYDLIDGKVRRITIFLDRREALEAVGRE